MSCKPQTLHQQTLLWVTDTQFHLSLSFKAGRRAGLSAMQTKTFQTRGKNRSLDRGESHLKVHRAQLRGPIQKERSQQVFEELLHAGTLSQVCIPKT